MINTVLPQSLRPYFDAEMNHYRSAFVEGNLQNGWRHLERAHILGQQYPMAHTLVHWEMLKFGIKMKSGKEVVGQIPRLVFGGVKSFVGKVPIGNPGGANVPPLKPFPIDQELQDIFVKVGLT